MNWKQLTLILQDGQRISRIPVTFTKTRKVKAWEDSEDDNDEDYEEINICYSDIDFSSEDNLEYNPWIEGEQYEGNPAIFLAEKEQANEQNQEWNLEKDLHVGPLDHHQQTLFLKVIDENADICAASQMDIGRTNILKHKINTGNNSPIAKQAYKSNPVKKEFIENEINNMKKKRDYQKIEKSLGLPSSHSRQKRWYEKILYWL